MRAELVAAMGFAPQAFGLPLSHLSRRLLGCGGNCGGGGGDDDDDGEDRLEELDVPLALRLAFHDAATFDQVSLIGVRGLL